MYLVFGRRFVIALSLHLQTRQLHLPALAHSIYCPDQQRRRQKLEL